MHLYNPSCTHSTGHLRDKVIFEEYKALWVSPLLEGLMYCAPLSTRPSLWLPTALWSAPGLLFRLSPFSHLLASCALNILALITLNHHKLISSLIPLYHNILCLCGSLSLQGLWLNLCYLVRSLLLLNDLLLIGFGFLGNVNTTALDIFDCQLDTVQSHLRWEAQLWDNSDQAGLWAWLWGIVSTINWQGATKLTVGVTIPWVGGPGLYKRAKPASVGESSSSIPWLWMATAGDNVG